jgi:hypothetical protein
MKNSGALPDRRGSRATFHPAIDDAARRQAYWRVPVSLHLALAARQSKHGTHVSSSASSAQLERTCATFKVMVSHWLAGVFVDYDFGNRDNDSRTSLSR